MGSTFLFDRYIWGEIWHLFIPLKNHSVSTTIALCAGAPAGELTRPTLVLSRRPRARQPFLTSGFWPDGMEMSKASGLNTGSPVRDWGRVSIRPLFSKVNWNFPLTLNLKQRERTHDRYTITVFQCKPKDFKKDIRPELITPYMAVLERHLETLSSNMVEHTALEELLTQHYMQILFLQQFSYTVLENDSDSQLADTVLHIGRAIELLKQLEYFKILDALDKRVFES